ncbi:tRNA(adenine(34)) deaminase, chloroplastic [Cicer arietinum]|uniref:tRNA(adenine(34)) deaminase n=1 Tax=Cicer arietinum TaxID=3827 RepID=A0A1S2XPW9_CICAR|nr:tRNA(adenine(34)) deaminase, chloroplastic [Cicer arietinum]
MHNTCFSSTIYGVSCKESFPLSSNGYSNLCYERFDTTSSHCLSCRACCALSTYRVPVNPCLLYGLRQSTLLHLSASRRLIFRGEDLYFSRVHYGLARGCYDLKCSTSVCNRSRRRTKETCFCSASQKGRQNSPSFDSDDSELVLSFLSEEADKDATGIKLKDVSSSKRMEAEKKRNNVIRERHLNLSEQIKSKKKGNLKKPEASSIDLRRECEKPDTQREAFSKAENCRKQRDMSSCSSYYTPSSGDFESDLDVQHKMGLEEFSLGYEKDEVNCMEEKVNEEFNRHRVDPKKAHGVSNKERVVYDADIDWNIRKKSEKKLTGGTVQETESIRGLQDMNPRQSTIHESGYGKVSVSQKQVHSEEDNSSFVEHLGKKTNKAYIQTGERRKHQSAYTQESGCDETETNLLSGKKFSTREGNLEMSETLFKETSDKHEKFVGSTSTTGKKSLQSKKTFSSKEGKLEISETLLQETSDKNKKIIGSTSTTTKDVIERNPQNYIGNLKIEDTERTSDTRMENMGEKKNSVLNSAQGVDLQHHKGEKIITHDKDRRRKYQQFSELSQAHGSVEDTSILKNKEEISYLSSHARDTWLQTDRRRTQSVQHNKGYENLSTLSDGGASDEKQVSSSQITSEKMRFIPKSKLESAVKTRESSSQTEERVFEFATDHQRPRKLSVSDETPSRGKSSFQGSLNSVSEAGKQVILAEGGKKSSEIMSIPSSSQMVRASARVEHTAGFEIPNVYLETSESGSSALYDNSGRSPAMLSGPHSQYGSDKSYSDPSINMTPEDVLGSANRLEESSKQFVDEFVERVRHEVTTSERQEIEVSRTKLAFDVEDNRIYSSKQQGTQIDSQSKNRDSSRSTGFPGANEISDKLWDVKEPSVELDQLAEKPEINNETAKPIVNRTGRSLWSMMADIVRLRWNSPRASSSTSAGRSGERNSPNKSDSETWFSGQEHEEIGKSNVMKDTSVLPQATTSDKSKPATRYTQSEGEVSDTKMLKDKGKLIEFGSSSPNRLESGSTSTGTSYARYTQSEGEVSDTKMLKDKGKLIEVGSSSPNKLESGSTSIGTTYAAGEEFSSQTGNAKDLKVTTSGLKKMESPIPLSVRGKPIAGEIVNIGGSDMSRTEPVVPVKEPIAQVKSEMSGSEIKDGELKQRKFQRNKQVLRDRFDDWEEAYKVEFEQRRVDEMFMNEALLEARKAADTWEVPVGAVLVQHGKIIARGCNLVEELRDSTAHAEMICIREASKLLHSWRLSETTLYVTLEPCPMCAGAILQARVDTVVWGAPNKLLGADGSWIRLFPDGGENVSEARDIPPAPVHPFHPKIKIRRGVLATECADVMQEFFQLRRRKKKEEPPKDPSCLPVTHHHPSKLLNKIHDIFHVMFCL